MFWRRCRVSYGAAGFGKFDGFIFGDGARDGDHRADGGDAVVEVGAVLGRAVKDGVGEGFNLKFVVVGVFAEWAMILAIFRGKTFDVGSFVEPGEMDAG